MKTGIIISTSDAETCWNALRYARHAISKGDEVKVFFMGKGVEYVKTSTEKFNSVEEAKRFMQQKGMIYACGTCIKSRNQEKMNICPISTLDDLHNLVQECDNILTF